MQTWPRTLARKLADGLRSESLHGALILAVLIVAFLWTPIARLDEAYYSSSDLLQDFSLTRMQANYPVGNRLMSDGVTEMKPWAMFNRDELAEGRIPWWNPWNGAGCPHFANYQSAVFSVFSLPGYLLGTKLALLVAPFLKLFALGFFTFLFLKKLRLRQIPALIGATAFMFGGHNILLLSFPHVGAQAVLPAGCYFAECVLQRFEIWARSFAGSTPVLPAPGSGGPFDGGEAGAGASPRLRGPLIGLALTFTLGLLAGQPEVFYFSFGLLAAFVAARMIGILLRTHRAQGAVRRLLGLAGRFSFVGLVALGLAAFQLLPFFEFLENSRLFEQRSHVQTPLSTEYWALMLFPDLIGNPSLPYNLSYTIPSPNYELVNMAYAGGLVVFLALVSLAFAWRDKLVLFFALAGTAWLFYAYDLCGAARLFALIPTVDLAPMNRSQGVWLFCLAVLAALAVDRVAAARPRARLALAVGTLAAALVFLTTFLIGADRLIEVYATVESDNHFRFPQFVPQHVRHMSELLAAGAFAIAVGWVVRARWVQALCGLAILLCTFLGSGWLLHDYNPVTENRLFYPVTPALHELTSLVGSERLAILGEDKLPPDVNLLYRLQVVDNYDGMWVQHYDHLYRDQFGDTGNWRPILKASQRALKLFGVRWVLAKWGWNFVDSGFNPLNRAAGQTFLRHEIVPGGTVTQTLVPNRNGLQAIAVYLSTHPNAKDKQVEFKLEDVAASKVVVRRHMTVEEIQASIYTSRHITFPTDYHASLPGRNVVFTFPPIANSQGRTYKFTLSSEASEDSLNAWSTPLLAYGDGQATWKDKRLKGELLFDFSCDLDHFEDVAHIGDYVLYRYKDALPAFNIVNAAVVAESDEEALALLRLPTFEPKDIVVLSDDASLPPAVRAQLGPVDNSHRRLVQVRGDKKVYLVQEEARRLVHIRNEVVFLINKFRWEQIEVVEPTAFEGWTRTFQDQQAQIDAGLRVVTPDTPGQEPPRLIESSPTRVVIEVDRSWPTYLVISQAWFPGWKAYVNGVETPVWRANYAFDAVALPAGHERIEFVYEPRSLRSGLWIGVVALGAGLGGLARRRRPAFALQRERASGRS